MHPVAGGGFEERKKSVLILGIGTETVAKAVRRYQRRVGTYQRQIIELVCIKVCCFPSLNECDNFPISATGEL